MSFLTPALLAGLAALAVPVLVHLAHRSRGRVTRFPSLLFLRRIAFRSRRRRAVRHPLLLLLRCGALSLAVLAFARPVVRAGGAGVAPGEAREVVLLLDRSLSMAYGDRWARAVAGLRRAVEELGPADRVSLVTFARRAETVVPPTLDRAAVLAALEGTEPGFGVTRYEPAFRSTRGLLEATELGRREVVLATDFQAGGWRDREPLGLPEGSRVRAVDVSDSEVANLAVTGAEIHRGRAGTARVTARLTNGGSAPASGVEVSLEVNGRPAATRRLDLEAGATVSVTFAGVPMPAGAVRGRVRILPPPGVDRLAADDEWHFVLAPEELLRVLIVEGRGGPADRSLYLKEALGIGDRPPLEVAVRRELRASEIAGRSLLVLNGAPLPGGGRGEAVREWVEAGGGLLVVSGPRSVPERRPAEGGAGLLPATVGEVTDRTAAGGGVLVSVAYDHPAFELFRTPRSGDLARARFLRYRRLEPSPGARVVARFDDGSPALVEGRAGEGRVLVWASTLDRFWNDLALQPVFLPFVQRLAVHAAGYVEPERWLTVGRVLDAGRYLSRRPAGRGTAAGETARAEGPPGEASSGRPPRVPAGDWVLESPRGGRRALRARSGSLLVALEEPGLHTLRRLDGPGERRVAVNLDPVESELAPLDPEELLAAASAGSGAEDPAASTVAAASTRTGEAGSSGGGAAARSAGSAEPPPPLRELWWIFLAAAGLLLLAEARLANGLSPGAGS